MTHKILPARLPNTLNPTRPREVRNEVDDEELNPGLPDVNIDTKKWDRYQESKSSLMKLPYSSVDGISTGSDR